MEYFDISYANDNLPSLALRLGYKKIFTIGKEVFLVEKESEIKQKSIIYSKDAPKLLKQSKVFAVVADKINEDLIQKIKGQEKILIIDASAIIRAPSEPQAVQNIKKARKIVSYALRSRVKLAIASFAKDAHGLISAEQMIELAKFLGANEGHAKAMLKQLGADQ
ncbi:MAG: hypothetical protein ACP5RF_01075 [Candidatus Micrarchaeia archaeon]